MVSFCVEYIKTLLTIAEIDVEESSIRQWILVHKLLMFILQSLSHIQKLFLCECPVLPLRGVPVIGSHLDVISETIPDLVLST